MCRAVKSVSFAFNFIKKPNLQFIVYEGLNIINIYILFYQSVITVFYQTRKNAQSVVASRVTMMRRSFYL